MQRCGRLSFVMVVVLLMSIAPPSVARAQSAERDVIAVVQKLFDGMRTRDTAAVRSVFDPMARLLGLANREGQRVVQATTVDQFVNIVARSAPGSVLHERIYDPEVRVDDDLAQVWTYYTFHRDTTFSHCGYDAFQLARTTAGWKITQLADTRRQQGCRTPPQSE
jgi:hypothetical protein